MEKVFFRDLGRIDYKEAWDLQESFFNEVIDLKLGNRGLPKEMQLRRHYLLFCEHPHVYTLGKSGVEGHLLIGEDELKEKNANYYKINRGGDITYHGPGQLVGYPIFDLDHFFTDIHKYLRFLEEAVIVTLESYGIMASRMEGLTGVWLDAGTPKARKICAMGVRCSRWVTMHGFALNVNADIGYFNHIVPCGISDKAVTSMHLETGREISMTEIAEKLKSALQRIFNMELIEA